MFLPKPSENGDFAPCPSGTHTAVCYRFVDKGTQVNDFNGERKVRREVMLSWEIGDELMEDGTPFTVHKTYTWSMHDKASLRKDLESWRGRAFEPGDFDGPTAFNTKKLLGVPCTLNITHTTKAERTYANVASVGKVMKSAAPKPLYNPTVYFSLDDGEFDAAVFGTLSDKLKTTISQSPEYKELASRGHRQDDPGGYAGHNPDEDIPF